MNDILINLDKVINERKDQNIVKSYSATLLNKGVEKCAEKLENPGIVGKCQTITEKSTIGRRRV